MELIKNNLYSISEVNSFINDGKNLIISGDESLLQKLDKGSWIGGTMHYFMTENGGTISTDKVLVNFLDNRFKDINIKMYSPDDMINIPSDFPENGASFILLPGLSKCAERYASETSFLPEILDSPIVGWCSGVLWENVATDIPRIMNGLTGELTEHKCVIMHGELPSNAYAIPNIVNIFEADTTDLIEFEEETSVFTDAIINGKKRNLYDYMIEKGLDIDLPLIADYGGAKINHAIQSLDKEAKKVVSFGVVKPGYQYHFAKKIEDFEARFTAELANLDVDKNAFACNCIYNFLFGNLENKECNDIVGPTTFGEVAFIFLTQTLVYLNIEETD